jgi:AcrR family transcriptional regulator
MIGVTAGRSATIPSVSATRASKRRPGGRVPREVREREMLEIAGALFAARGYHDVSMEEVARAAGVTKPMVYAYFDSKEGLFLACVEGAAGQLIETLERETSASLPPEVRLWRGLLAVFDFIEENREAWAVLYPHGPQSGAPFSAGAQKANEAMAGLLARLLRDAAVAEGVDPALAAETGAPFAHALVGAVEGVASWWLRHPDEPKELQALRLMNLAWMGLGNAVRGNLWVPPPEA